MARFGIVVKTQSGFFWVQTQAEADSPAEILVCKLRGKLRHKRLDTDVIALGDRVWVEPTDPGEGLVLQVEPRVRQLSRRAPPPRREAEQVIVANPDQAVFVFACTHPEPRLRMLDRFLVIAEAKELPAIIGVNKIDLLPLQEALAQFETYRPIGYRVLPVSAKTGQGITELREVLVGKLSVLAGPSGVGKSTLLNTIEPGLGRRVNEISQATGKGRHTTVVPELVPLASGGFVADTPGLKTLALWDIEPEELDAYFIEMRPFVAQCEFNNCTHLHEPGCAIRRAVETGQIAVSRYDSYCRLRGGEES